MNPTKKKSMKVLVAGSLFLFFSLAAFAQIPLTSDDLNQFSWRPIGPWAFSGRIANFAVPPGQSQTYYVLTATGGLWKTVDSGISFEPLFEKYGTMSMGYLAIAPSKPAVLYLGTGEPMHARASYHGNGMWKSVDAGKTWNHIGLEKSFFIPKVAVHPTNPDIVYAAAEGKLYDNEMDCERGLYRTADGGKTWQRVLDLKDRGVGDFAVDPANFDVVIAAAYKTFRRTWTYIDRQEGNVLFKTTDGGKSWKKLAGGLPDDKVKTGRNGLAIYEKNPKIVYARIDEEVNVGLSEGEGAAQFREEDIFKDGYYFNKFSSFKINPELLKLVKFTPVSAKTEKDLAEELNKLVKDREFQKKLGIDLAVFNARARKIHAKDKKVTDAIAEIERTMKREQENKDLYKKINRLVLYALFADSPGVEFKENVVVHDSEKVSLNPAFRDLLTFDPKTVKDEKDLVAKMATLADDPEFLSKLKINLTQLSETLKTAYKEKPEILAKFKDAEEIGREYDETRGRYQTVNRYILEILYANCLKIVEPIKKAGVLYRSEDQGETWKRMTDYRLVAGSDEVNQVEAGYAGRLLIDPANDQVLYAHETRTTVSRDSGKNFKFANWESDTKAHVDSRAVWVDPLSSLHILDANDGGVSESWDGGKHWSQKETISAQQFYDISVDNEQPYNVMGGTQDNGCWLGPSQNRNAYGVYPADWNYLPSGDGFYVVRDWWNPEYIYWESQFGFSSRGNLKTGASDSLSYRNSTEERAAGEPPQRYQWNAPIALSPHNPGIVYVCSQHVFMSRSRGEKDTWVRISPDLTKNDKERLELSKKTNLQYATIFTFAESPKKPGFYWAGTDDGNLQLSTDGGNSWTNITAKFYDKAGKPLKGFKGALIPYDRWVKRVLPSRHDLNTCYVAFSGYRTHNEDKTYVFVTRDLGKTWEDISGGMNNPVSDIKEDPANPDVLYLATDYGLYVTLDRGKHWLAFSTTAPQAIIKDLAIQARDREIAIATYGRGFFIADIGPFKEFKEETFKKPQVLFDVKTAVVWNRLERRGQTLGEFARAANPPIGSSVYYYLKDAVKNVRIQIKDLEGNLVQELKGKTDKGLQKVFWDLSKISAEGGGRGGGRRRFGFGGSRVEPGVYKVVLLVDDKETVTKKMTVAPDPLFK